MSARARDPHRPRAMFLPSIPRAVLPALLVAGAASAQPPRDTLPLPARDVVLDGLMHEWDAAPAVFSVPAPRGGHDTAGAPAPRYARVEQVKVRHDAGAVYLQLALDGAFALQAMPGTLELLLDEDADPATGWDLDGMKGVDALVQFSAPFGKGGERMGTGIRLMHAEGRASCLARANAVGIMAAPSHASRWHEVRLPRSGDGLQFGARMRARLVSRDSAGGVVQETPVFTVDLPDARPRHPDPAAWTSDPLARAPAAEFRVVSWNVGRETFFTRADSMGALLRPLAPDLLLLDEVAGGHSTREVEDVLNRILPGERPWRAVYGTSGGSQRGVIAVRGAAPVVAPAFAGVLPYPDSTRAIIPPDDAGAAAWLDSRLRANVPVTGAVVEMGGRRLLAVTVDLESGGEPGGPRDRLRRIEALAIRDALAAAVRAGGVDGVLVAGDFNLVASRDPLDILAAGPDVDGSGLAAMLPLRLDGTTAATWEKWEEPFTPSRLDFVLVGDARLGAERAFVFRAADLPPAWRAHHGLAEDASRVTDHLPLVTDLRWTDRP